MQRRHFIQSAGALALGMGLFPWTGDAAFAMPNAAGTLEVFAGAIGPVRISAHRGRHFRLIVDGISA
ncbi:MAG: hypothetical protein RBR52_01600 [Thiomonas sp.]|uniref:hypothetical protein n=1 Tax=Thiomonas sp. TaxID=2047785 RepID=UPI002A358B9C|nr:hypothetical protein [Thiomonas sp.]MDY0329175.1 hypothetical protein [Thiomonas sp.]